MDPKILAELVILILAAIGAVITWRGAACALFLGICLLDIYLLVGGTL